MWRDLWAWASALAVTPLVLHSLGARLGEPVADDFACLHRALLTPGLPLIDGYGSALYWRPLSRQIYFKLLAPLMLPQPAFIAALHVVLLALVSLLLYRSLRPIFGGPLAALAASFALLMESTRMLLTWPSGFQDLGAMFFAALAIHEAAAARLATTLAALLGSLLCKELMAPAALLLPWLPTGTRHRMRWFSAIAVTVGAWGIAYAIVHHAAGLAWSHPPEDTATPDASWPARYLWACGTAARAAMSLPASSSPSGPLAGGLLLIVALAVAASGTVPSARARLARALPWAGWGCAWFVAGTLTLAATYPDWLAYRGAFAAMGLGVAFVALAGAAHPALAWVLLAGRLALFALSPGPPALVGGRAEERGALLDFPKLARLQRLVSDTRHALHDGLPSIPAGGQVGLYNLPWMAEYGFSGSQALQVWYRDSTLRWVRSSEFMLHPETPLRTIAEFENGKDPSVVLLNPEAMRAMTGGITIANQGKLAAALVLLDRADSLASTAGATAFHGQVAGLRAVTFAYLGRLGEAEKEAGRSKMLYPRHPYAHLALGVIAFSRGRWAEADAQVDSVLDVEPNYPPALRLRASIREAVARPAPSASRR